MNLPPDHPLKESDLAKLNNPLGNAREPVFPFIFKAKILANQKIQVEDQQLTLAGIPFGDQVKHSIQMLYFGLNNTIAHNSLLALRHAYEYLQHVCSLTFLDLKKRGKLFAATLKGTAASCWEAMVNEKVNMPTFQPTLQYFQECLQDWTKLYFSQDSQAKHFTFMWVKGSIFKDHYLHIDEYAFSEVIYLYNEMDDLLWPNPAEPVKKLNENELKLCFFNGQPRCWRLQFLEAPGAPHPETMTVKQLKAHFKLKEDNAAKQEALHAEVQCQKAQKK